VASLSLAAEQLEGCIDAMVANRVSWGTRSMLVATLSHFPELGAELKLLGSGRGVDQSEDQVDFIWTGVRLALDFLALQVPLSVAHGPPIGAVE
jgi:hypothetical protein